MFGSAMSRVVAVLVGVGSSMLLLTGCGTECGPGTELNNGVCSATAVSSDRCGPGTHLVGTECLPLSVGPDGGPSDGPGHEPPPPRDCSSDPTICGLGSTCDAATKTCVPQMVNRVMISNEVDPQLPFSLDPAFVVEGGKLMLYYTMAGGPAIGIDVLAIQTQGRVMQTINFGAAKVEIDPTTLMRKSDPQEVSELPGAVGAAEFSANGKWMIWSCFSQDFGGPMKADRDLCMAQRANDTDPWGNVRIMTEIASPQSESDPGIRSDANGDPAYLFWSAAKDNNSGGSSDVCYAQFDKNANRAVNVPMANGQPVCQAFQAEDIPGMQITISDPFSTETCPTWSTDGQYFAWSRVGLGTQGYDSFIGKSSAMNGTVDQLLGPISANTDSNELGFVFAPFTGNFKGIVAWNDAPDVVTLSRGLNLHLGKIEGL